MLKSLSFLVGFGLLAGCSTPSPSVSVDGPDYVGRWVAGMGVQNSAIPRVPVQNSVKAAGAVFVNIIAASGFSTKAAAKVLGDIDHYVVKLYNTTGPTLVYTHTTPDNANTAFYFNNVVDGTYNVTAEAFDSGNASITQGGAQTSSNTVTVSGATATYSAGTALTASLSLLNQTAAQLDSALSVTPGSNAPAITVTPH